MGMGWGRRAVVVTKAAERAVMAVAVASVRVATMEARKAVTAGTAAMAARTVGVEAMEAAVRGAAAMAGLGLSTARRKCCSTDGGGLVPSPIH